MSFSFGTPKTAASGFTLPTNPPATTTAGGFQFNTGSGSGDTKLQNKPSTGLFGSPAANTASTGSLSFGATPSKTLAPTFSFGTPTATASAAPALSLGTSPALSIGTTPALSLGTSPALSIGSAPALSLGTGSTITAATSTPGFSFGSNIAASTASFTPIVASTAPATTTGISLGATPATTNATAPKLTFGLAATTTPATTTAPALSLASAVSTAVAPTSVTSTTSTIPATGSLTFAQLEDSINKWTIDLEEQGKFFINQAKQLNAWDSLLISNGEKILNLNSSIERVKQQQQQLDQELDFVLAQQKELEELIVPLEKELTEIPVTDIDRNQMYQFCEIIDSQLKQMSDDLKEIIEHINESNKNEEMSNPVTQIGRILNAHMNSLQWIDRNTAQVSAQLEQINKMQDSNRKNLSLNLSLNHSIL